MVLPACSDHLVSVWAMEVAQPQVQPARTEIVTLVGRWEVEPDHGSSSGTVGHPPENICSQDFIKEEYQVNERIQARGPEISRSLLKSNRGHVLKYCETLCGSYHAIRE
ncbi:hypothetical protein ANCCAN_00303 [Ancylostoma caninum]|uniref:Uncharacterized protein n=1 Tax=Ancylostoma caninum TaxID=29170 RepID=A0A368HDV0_ANCCA|nr:hypothetical protein ANCCAN_00303 [Ancylostoma caninum]